MEGHGAKLYLYMFSAFTGVAYGHDFGPDPGSVSRVIDRLSSFQSILKFCNLCLCTQYQLRTNVLRDQVVAGLVENGCSTDEGLTTLFAAMCAATVPVEEHEA